MDPFTSTNKHGDLSLFHDVMQVCIEEVEQLLALQQQSNRNSVVFDFSEAIDVRLGVISSLNKMAIDCAANILPKFTYHHPVAKPQGRRAQLSMLQRLVSDTSQNIELISTIQRFIQDKVAKKEFENVIRSLKHSQEQLSGKAHWLERQANKEDV
ncbi:hypothetical protein ACFSJY_02345 [Thalassotalea euphylliae]|uniref:hypothetical protein n=1 Tax=Thalassotalea euphylliae TaxID=1655234 RepID=UPI003636B647